MSNMTDDVAAAIPHQDGAEGALPFPFRAAWDAIVAAIPGVLLTLNRAMPDVDVDALLA